MEVMQFGDCTPFAPLLQRYFSIQRRTVSWKATHEMIVVLITQWRDTTTTPLCRALASGDGDE